VYLRYTEYVLSATGLAGNPGPQQQSNDCRDLQNNNCKWNFVGRYNKQIRFQAFLNENGGKQVVYSDAAIISWAGGGKYLELVKVEDNSQERAAHDRLFTSNFPGFNRNGVLNYVTSPQDPTHTGRYRVTWTPPPQRMVAGGGGYSMTLTATCIQLGPGDLSANITLDPIFGSQPAKAEVAVGTLGDGTPKCVTQTRQLFLTPDVTKAGQYITVWMNAVVVRYTYAVRSQ
jgi:hypothetical protein